jgi:hypothetical protein
MAGCGGITGDLPPVTGQVIRIDTNEAVPNAQVTLTTEDGQQFVTYTDEEGRFSFQNVPPGPYSLFVEPPAEVQPAALEAQQIRFEDGSSPTFMAIGLPPVSGGPPLDPPMEVVIEPAEKIVFLEPQPQQIRFTVRLVGDNVDGLRPQWLVRGDIGQIDVEGVFTPTRVGTGLVIANVSGVEAVAVVRVERHPPPGAMRPIPGSRDQRR